MLLYPLYYFTENLYEFFFLVQIFFIVTLIPSGLPLELQEKIVGYIGINLEEQAAQIPLKKSMEYYEGLVFPSTSSIVLVKMYNRRDKYTQSKLRTLVNNCEVLPHIQLWFDFYTFRIDNDLKVINTNIDNLSNINNRKKIFFDGCADKDLAILLTQRKDCIKLTIRDFADKANVIQAYISQKPLQSLSLCFHNNGDSIEYSFIAQNPDDNSVCMHYHSLNHVFFKKFFTFKKTEILIPIELSDIKKHEFIGKNSFLLLVSNQLFFMVLDSVPIFKHQSFTRSGPQESMIAGIKKNEYDVLSFAAYHEKRTRNGRARFIVVLVKNEVERKILFIDLLDPFTKAHPLWCSGQDSSLYDRISFIGNIVTLWVDDPENSNALEIRLPFNWVDDYLTLDLTLKIFGKMVLSSKSKSQGIDCFKKLLKIDSIAIPESKAEDLGTLLLPKKRGNYGMPLYSKRAFFWIFLTVGLMLYSARYLIKAFYQK